MATANPTANPMKSKTDQAIDYLNANKDKGVTAYAAAQKFGLSHSTIYKRMKLLSESTNRCPCCGQAIRGAK